MDEPNKLDKIDEEIRDLTLEVKIGFTRYNELLARHIEGVEQNRENIAMLREELAVVDDFVKSSKTVITVSKWLGIPTIVVSAILYILNKI